MVTIGPGGSIPPIPHLDVWQSLMLSLAAKWGAWLDNPANMPLAFGVESQVWYYDGGRVYEQVAAYTGDTKWLKYADLIHSQYGDYVITNNGGIPGWRVFGIGFYQGYERLKDAKNAQALDTLVNGSKANTIPGVELRYYRQHGTATQAVAPGNPINPQWNPLYIRESAYIVKAMVVEEIRTGARHPLLDCGVFDCVVPDLTAFMTPGSSTYLGAGTGGNVVNNFMIGLALEALILYYEMTVTQGTPDARIPPIVKQVIDFFWLHCVDHATNITWYNSTSGLYDSNLGLMTAPAFAWYWRYSKDLTYLTQGDMLFGAAITGNELQDTGKQFSANFAWTFDYVKWRSA